MAWIAPFDPFEALGLERDATPGSIKSKYHELARRYHPNRNQGTDDSKTALSEYFHHVNQAWQLLSEPEKRRRYVELLNLYDLHETILATTTDLSQPFDHGEHRPDHPRTTSDGHVSSDADDDDLPRIAGIKKRETFDRPAKTPSGLDDIPEGSDSDRDPPKDRKSRLRGFHLRGRIDSGRDSDGNDQNVAAERRRRFDKLRRKELEAFNNYREAMVEKFEAEEAAEMCKELFEQARWRREYFERAPRETTQRMRLIRLFHNATKAFTAQQQPIGRRKGSSVSQGGQILSTGDPLQSSPQNNQFLTLPSRTKSFRRKGFSSDISADQTSSSEDNSSDKAASPKQHARAASPAPNHRRHRSGDSIPTSLRLTPRRLPNTNQDPISPISGPGPLVFVRTPTNLHEMAEAQGSDGAPVSASSRSPSPEEEGDADKGRFKLLPPLSTSKMFGTEREGRSRSPSADHRSAPTNGHLPRTHSPLADATFQIKQVGQLQYRNIPLEHVHELSNREKQWTLSVEPDEDSNPFELLRRLSKLDEAVAERLMVKADIKNAFNFRLIYSHREVTKNQHDSFIALSYRRKLHVEKKHHHFTLPLEPEIFQAVWDERISDKEGVWIDQICIDQNSDEEKNVSMSAMDMVYRSARLVVVALDDIDLEAHEGLILENHMEEFHGQVRLNIPPSKRFRHKSPPYLESHDDLYVVIRKIMRSSWFKRAWCRHEMRLAREHIFLVPCRSPGSWSERSVLRFTGKCLTHFLGLAIEVPFEPAIEAVKPALYAFFRDRSKLSPEHHLRSHHGNFTTVVAEVFAMEAGGDPKVPDEQREADARKDKIAIILNTMECGLALRQRVRKVDFSLPIYECNYMLLMLALAARDPGALCSVGHPLQPLPYDLSSSWLLEPTNVDSGLNNYRTLNRLPREFQITTHSDNTEHFVQLDLKFLSRGQVVRPLESHENLALARHFADVCEQRELGRNRKRYLLKDKTANHLFGSMRDVYVQTLVCLFECGPDWLSEVCQRYGVSRWKHDLQQAYDLLIAFKNTMGLWPDHAWRPQAAGFLIDFVNFLVIRGMPQRQTTQPEEWRPICVTTRNGGKVLTFIPPGDIRVAVPTALLDSDYLHLARLYVMEPRGECNEHASSRHNEWTLRGKSVMFSDEDAMELLESDQGDIRGGQKVFGRPAQPPAG